MYSYGSPHTAAQKQEDQHERTFSSYVRIQVVVLKTYLGRWTIGRSGERGSGISVLPARYDDDDIYIYIYNSISPLSLFSLLSLSSNWADNIVSLDSSFLPVSVSVSLSLFTARSPPSFFCIYCSSLWESFLDCIWCPHSADVCKLTLIGSLFYAHVKESIFAGSYFSSNAQHASSILFSLWDGGGLVIVQLLVCGMLLPGFGVWK